MMDHPDLFVIGRLLEGLLDGPLRRTQLQQRAGLNYTVFQRYLEFLMRLDLVNSPGEEGRLELTSKGVEAYRFLSEGLSRIFGIGTVPRQSLASQRGPPRAAASNSS
jgi:predicted transcriptional regulator